MQATPLQRVLAAVFGWVVALLLFFPIAWMVLTSFKSERDAVTPGLFCFARRSSPITRCSRAPTI